VSHVLAIGLVNSLLWSLYLLLTRHVVNGAQLDAWAYTLVQLLTAGLALLWLSALVTLYTGWDYLRAGLKHVIDE